MKKIALIMTLIAFTYPYTAAAFESRFSMGPNAEWGVTYLEGPTMVGVGRIVLKNDACTGFNKFMDIPFVGQALIPLRVLLVCEEVPEVGHEE